MVPEDWYGENDVELRLGVPVTGVDPAARTVVLGDGGRLEYGSLLLATGARPGIDSRCPAAGWRASARSGRSRTAAACAPASPSGGRNVVMVGSGWIGMELAAAASTYGNTVTLLGLEEVPLGAAIGPELGGFFRSLHEAQGCGSGFRRRLPKSGAVGRVTGVVTDSGEVLPADLVVIAVGVVPEVCLAAAAGLGMRNGILTDASLRTYAPGIFAAGDVANALHPFTGEHHRSEHWSNALNGGKVAAKAMLGQDAALDTIPYFYTDQYDVSMEYSGFPTLVAGPPVIRGSLEEQNSLRSGSARAGWSPGMSVNWPRAAKPQKTIKALITARTAGEPGLLADPRYPWFRSWISPD